MAGDEVENQDTPDGGAGDKAPRNEWAAAALVALVVELTRYGWSLDDCMALIELLMLLRAYGRK